MKPSDPIEELTEILKKDLSSPQRRYPEQAIYALRDERLVKSVRSRFKNGQALIKIGSLGYNFSTGLNHIFFEFALPGRIALSSDAVLVITDKDCRVVGLVDPLDLNQPNPLLPPIQREGDRPFVLAQPSASETLTQSAEELSQSATRANEFFSKIGVDVTPNMMIGPGGSIDPFATTCDYLTRTFNDDRRADRVIDDSGSS